MSDLEEVCDRGQWHAWTRIGECTISSVMQSMMRPVSHNWTEMEIPVVVFIPYRRCHGEIWLYSIFTFQFGPWVGIWMLCTVDKWRCGSLTPLLHGILRRITIVVARHCTYFIDSNRWRWWWWWFLRCTYTDVIQSGDLFFPQLQSSQLIRARRTE